MAGQGSGTSTSLSRRRFGSLLALPALASAIGACRRSTEGDGSKPAVTGSRSAEAAASPVEVDLSTILGPLHRLSGVQGSPAPIVDDDLDHRDRFRAHHIEHARFPQDCHPNTLTLGAIFPDENADPSRPESYRFEAIDRHITAAQAAGARVLWQSSYDVGRSDSWHTLNLQGRPPSDLDRWSEVVTHCLEHFNNRWAGGLAHAVPHVEFVNEPNGLGGFRGLRAKDLLPAFLRFVQTIEQYNRAHPDTPVKAVGPGIPFSFPDWDRWKPRFTTALERLRAEGRKLDVFSFHTYGDDVSPQANAMLARALRTLLDQHGMKDTELWNTEWQAGDFLRKHLRLPPAFDRDPSAAQLRAYGAGLATYALSCKIRWQGLLQGSYYYRANMRAFPPKVMAKLQHRRRLGYAMLFTPRGETRPLAFQETLTHRLSRETPLRCPTTWQDDGLLAALGLRSQDGSKASVLLCNLHASPRQIPLRLTGLAERPLSSVKVTALDGESEPLAEQAISPPPPVGGELALSTTIPPLGTRWLLVHGS